MTRDDLDERRRYVRVVQVRSSTAAPTGRICAPILSRSIRIQLNLILQWIGQITLEIRLRLGREQRR